MALDTGIDLDGLDPEIQNDIKSKIPTLPSDHDPISHLQALTDNPEPTTRYETAISILSHLTTRPPNPNTNLPHLITQKLISLPPQPFTADQYPPKSRQAAEASLFALAKLLLPSVALPQSSLLTLVAYTDPSQPWTTPLAAATAGEVLERYLSHDDGKKQEEFIVGDVLQGYLRPIFSNAASVRVTESGRPAHFVTPGTQRATIEEPTWKKAGAQVVSVFAWAVENADSSLIAKNWPLFTPPLLAIAEDSSNSVRATGLSILATFISKCPNTILQTTGIATVFQDAIFPTLLFLPSLTPEEEAVRMLRPAYAALLELVKRDDDQRRRVKLMDKILRDGVLAGFYHAGEYTDIVGILMEVTAQIVTCMGLSCVKHLQVLLSMFSAVLTDPFGDARPVTLLQTAKAQNAVIQNAWPRIMSDAPHEGQIINTTSVCWLTVKDTAAEASEKSKAIRADVQAELKITGTMIIKLRKERSLGPPPLMKEILREEPRLRELFQEG